MPDDIYSFSAEKAEKNTESFVAMSSKSLTLSGSGFYGDLHRSSLDNPFIIEDPKGHQKILNHGLKKNTDDEQIHQDFFAAWKDLWVQSLGKDNIVSALVSLQKTQSEQPPDGRQMLLSNIISEEELKQLFIISNKESRESLDDSDLLDSIIEKILRVTSIQAFLSAPAQVCRDSFENPLEFYDNAGQSKTIFKYDLENKCVVADTRFSTYALFDMETGSFKVSSNGIPKMLSNEDLQSKIHNGSLFKDFDPLLTVETRLRSEDISHAILENATLIKHSGMVKLNKQFLTPIETEKNFTPLEKLVMLLVGSRNKEKSPPASPKPTDTAPPTPPRTELPLDLSFRTDPQERDFSLIRNRDTKNNAFFTLVQQGLTKDNLQSIPLAVMQDCLAGNPFVNEGYIKARNIYKKDRESLLKNNNTLISKPFIKTLIEEVNDKISIQSKLLIMPISEERSLLLTREGKCVEMASAEAIRTLNKDPSLYRPFLSLHATGEKTPADLFLPKRITVNNHAPGIIKLDETPLQLPMKTSSKKTISFSRSMSVSSTDETASDLSPSTSSESSSRRPSTTTALPDSPSTPGPYSRPHL